jgi:hypothetical protein
MREKKMLNPKNLTESDIETLIYNGEGWVCSPIERAILLLKYNKELYAAVYHVEFEDDGSFPDEETRIEGTKVFISYLPNGTMIAKL